MSENAPLRADFFTYDLLLKGSLFLFRLVVKSTLVLKFISVMMYCRQVIRKLLKLDQSPKPTFQ